MSVRIGFTGDVMLGRLVDERQRTSGRPPEAVWGDVFDRLRGLDGLVINLECCLSTRGQQWTRTHRPFHFRADPDWAVPALERAGVDICALANNHVLDYEAPALRDTLAHLDAAGIARSGAGETIDEALEPAIVTVGGPGESTDAAAVGENGETDPADDGDGLTVAVVSLTDNTPEYAASEDGPGTAWIEIDVDDPESRERVRTCLDRARAATPDLVVASLHWGPNMVVEPPASFRAFGRWLIEEGVDVVHGHSAHVAQGVEIHEGRPIWYDCGDFVDDYRVDPELRNDRSFLFELAVRSDGTPEELRLNPVEIEERAVYEAGDGVAAWSRERLRERSAPFGTEFERDGEALVCELGD